MQKPLAYRAEVDGLRSIAIIPVLLFHTHFPGFSGGFVGVDVFFVISGFLITGIISREISAGDFSIVEFYRRRVLRIFPALFAMVAVTASVACVYALPIELTSIFKSVISTAAFSSNILFYGVSGYFGAAAESMPLLHTWSLAVEEQFYLVWPLLLLWMGRRRSGALGLTIGAGVVSFVVAVLMLRGDPSASFYLIPSRAWELLVGAFIALAPMPVLSNRKLREVISLGGLAAILYTVRIYTSATPFPGASALPPVLGAAAIIAATGYGPTFVGKLLSCAPFVFIGKISFSLYLWHWPIIIFAHTALHLEQTRMVKLALVASSLLMAVVSWRFVEQPFRSGSSRWSSKLVLRVGGALTAGTVALGAVAVFAGGFPGRFSPEELTIATFESYDGDHLYRGGQCFVVQPGDPYDRERCLSRSGTKPTLLVVGDSHAAHLWPGLNAVATGTDVLQATATGCRPSINTPSPNEPPCRTFFRDVLGTWLREHPVDKLVLSGRWQRDDLPALEATLPEVAKSAKEVVLVGPIPQYATALTRIIVHTMQSGDQTMPNRALMRDVLRLDDDMKRRFSGSKVRYVSLVDALCPQGQCRTFAQKNVPMQFDYGHLTLEGSDIVAKIILDEASK